MAATYDITSHPLLSDKAKALYADDANTFDAVVVAVERTLGLHGTDFTGDDAGDAKLAIVLETNYELEQTPESEVYTRIDRGERTWQYKSDLKAVHPRAERIAQRLLGSLEDGGDNSRSSSSVAVPNNYTW